ncbi:hypothetical protein B0J11DRAFT_534821 [Dendryphion nanum]|uniref:Uncharacterized protein n=1 Tax=Dendryphion nanum TaxID=256645 RepID=A0A9P9DG10_9PLEO|nr:hypothetical protein B0J11DRAFT_534821 [Dendryphion nanum]
MLDLFPAPVIAALITLFFFYFFTHTIHISIVDRVRSDDLDIASMVPELKSPTKRIWTILFTTPISVLSLPEDARSCPICQEPYCDFEPYQLPRNSKSQGEAVIVKTPAIRENDPNCTDPEKSSGKSENLEIPTENEDSTASAKQSEIPVCVRLSAGAFGHRRLCGHVLGQHCLEILMMSKGPWRHKCPVCRHEWSSGENNLKLFTPPQSPISRNPFRAILQLGKKTFQSERPQNAGDSMEYSTAFMQRIVEEFKLNSRDEDITGTIDDVEKRLREFYGT